MSQDQGLIQIDTIDDDTAVVTLKARIEETHETMIEQAARIVTQSLRETRKSKIIIDLTEVNYFGSVAVSFLLRLHGLAKKGGGEVVLFGASGPAKELLQLLDLDTLFAEFENKDEAIKALQVE